MNIFTFRRKTHDDGFGPIQTRRVLRLSVLNGKKIALGINGQFRSKINDAWRDNGYYRQVSLGFPMHFGRFDLYYDGDHIGISIGILHFDWGG